MTKHMIRFVAVAILGFALAPVGAAIVPITSVSETLTVGTPDTLILDTFTAGGTLYTTATDLSLGTSVETDVFAGSGVDINDQDNFDLNLIFSRGGNAADCCWNTSLFGGANWSDSNGSAADFFIFEANGNDTLNVAPIFTDDSVGQYVTIASSGVNWGNTGVTITGDISNGQTIFGVAFAITDLKDAGGVALTNSTVIKGLAFDGPNTDIASISAVPAPDTDPAITFKNPADGATNVAIHANLVATFDESIALTGSGTITIRDLGAGSDVVIPLPDDQVSVSGAVLTINPTADLLPDNAYAVRISADAVEDLATNAFAGILNDTTWNFDTVEAVAEGYSSLVFPGPGDVLEYAEYANEGQVSTGNRMIDFSYAGYQGGGVAIPWVPVELALDPVAGGEDDHARIQTAIDTVSALPLSPAGFRGALLLRAGTYNVSETLLVTASGVVIRGEGQGSGGTVINFTATVQDDLFDFSGSNVWTKLEGTETAITDALVPSGVRSFNVASSSGLSVGDRLMVHRTPNEAWIDLLDMAQWGWTAANYDDFETPRRITAIDGNTITVDAPLVHAIETQYGGGEVYRYHFDGAIKQVGIERLRLESAFTSNTDEAHGWSAVRFNKAENAWARQVTAKYFGYSCVDIRDRSLYVTVEDCAQLDPKSNISGGRRYSFRIDDSSFILFQRCYCEEGRHDFVSQSETSGPNVFVDGLAESTYSDIGPHHRYSEGVLFDNIKGGAINVQNREGSGTGHGWAGAQTVFWNCEANSLICDAPKAAMNFAIGCVGTKQQGAYAPGESFGFWESHQVPVTPRSLYYTQLADRLGNKAMQTVVTPAQSQARVWADLSSWHGDSEAPGLPPFAPVQVELGGDITTTLQAFEMNAVLRYALPANFPITVGGWTQLGGPSSVVFGDSLAASTTVTFPGPGTYELAFSLSQQDDRDPGNVITYNGSDSVLVTIPSPPAGVTIVDIGIDGSSSVRGTSDWNTSLTLDANGNAYAAFVDENMKNTVVKVTPGGVVTSQIIDPTDNEDDAHNTPAIAIDGDGFLHVAYNMHNHNMRLRKSPAANSVSGTWVDEGGTGSPWGAGRFTYPAMSTAPNGDVYMSIRNRESGGPVQLFHYDNTTDSWSSIAKFADEVGYTAYLPAPYVDESGKVHLSWHWQQGGPGAERQRGSYAVYDPDPEPGDPIWSKADGTAYIIPITTTTADLYQPSEAAWGVKQIADHSLTVNALGQPIIAYNFFREGDNDQRVLRLSRWDDLASAWQRTDLEGPVTGTTLGDPVIVNRDGTLHIYYNDADGKLTLRSSADNGLTFGDAITLTDHAVRAAHVLIGGTSIGSNQEAIFFLDPSDNYAAKVMFVDYAQVADADSDGLPDLWEDEHFGDNDGTPTPAELLVSDGSGDFDGDGTPDLNEFRLGLIPTDPNSTFTLDVSPGLAADTAELSWPSQEGLHFEIRFTEDLSLALANWSVISPITDGDGDGAPTHEWTDEDAASSPWRFYRVGLLP